MAVLGGSMVVGRAVTVEAERGSGGSGLDGRTSQLCTRAMASSR